MLRDPTGNTPCYHARYDCVDVFFSHIEDYIQLLDPVIEINLRSFSRWLIAGTICARETAVKGVEETPSGERVTLCDSRLKRAQVWNPQTLAAHPHFDNPLGAAKRMRDAIQATIEAWSSCYEHVGVRLSGGLDSAIVALCLARLPARPKMTCFNFGVDAPYGEARLPTHVQSQSELDKYNSITSGGDERFFAKLVAQHCGTSLLERRRDPGLDVRRMWQAPLTVVPALYYTMIEVEELESDLSQRAGVQAYFTGQAGDAVLQVANQPFAAIDYAYLHGIRGAVWHHIFNAIRLSRESLWSVVGKTLKYGLLRSPYAASIDYLSFPSLVSDAVLASISARDFESPWAELLTGLPPGKQDHLSGLAGSMYYNFVFHCGQYADHIDPLNSQLVWEALLEIPTYTLLLNGVSRGLARYAFADLLPSEIRKRRGKGSGGAFYQGIVERNKSFLREVLMNGHLVTDNYLDRRKLQAYFEAENPHMVVGASQLLSYVAAEVWLQQITELGRSFARPIANSAGRPRYA